MDIDAGRFVASFVGEKMEVGYFGLAFFFCLLGLRILSVHLMDVYLADQTCRIPARDLHRFCSSVFEASV